MDANPRPAGCPCDLARSLHGSHRVAARLVMVLLSHCGWPTSAIARLLGCDASTVRRWVHRDNAEGIADLPDGAVDRSKLVKRWLAAYPRLLVLHEARYSSHDNPVQPIWARPRRGWPTRRP